MANSPQDDRFYKSETLLKWFAISSGIMLLVTIWMVMDDFGREWKGYQREFLSLKKKKYDVALEEAEKASDKTKIEEINKARVAAAEQLKAAHAEIEPLEKELIQIRTKEKNSIKKYQSAKAVWDVEKYHYEAEHGHHVAESYLENKAAGDKAAAELHHEDGHSKKQQNDFDALMKSWGQVLVKRDAANALSQTYLDKKAALDAKYAARDQAEKDLKSATAEVDRIKLARDGSTFGMLAAIRSSPILDLASPVLKLNQIVLPTIRDDVYFAQVQKVDRCTTCHLAIDLPGFENEKQPFRTHPKLDIMLGSRSPHPIDKIGCTVCHEGRGQATEFTRTAHTPQNAEQQKEWEKKYGWHSMHHVIEKMVPLQYTEGKCRVCHRQTEYVPKAEKLNASVQLIRSAGCYGCHRIEGWDHIRKPAPSLKRVKGKLSRDWIAKWVRDPQSFNQHARMPSVFNQSNMKSAEFQAHQEAELQAITDYLLAESEEYKPSHNGVLGSVDRGKELFSSVGCLGCHQIEDFGHPHGRFGMAPDLSTVGSKVTKDWLYSWLKNPRHYFADTQMPSLRLSDGEIGDLTAYLMSKKNADFEAKDAGAPNVDEQKKVLRLYLLRDPKMAPATEAKVDDYLNKLNPAEVTQQLGKNAVMRYGCYGCHEIKGMEKTQGIGTELTEWGSKPVNKLDFGLLHLHHSNYAWADQKLESTRSFDEGLVKEYLDTLRMPNFHFTKEERQSLITALLGMTAQKIDPPAAKRLNAHETMVEEGSRIIHKYNCQGCHVVEGMHVPMPEGHPMWEEHEKGKYKLEGRVLTYYQEDETLGPPPLVTEGERVKTAWAYDFLHDPGKTKLRTKLKIRMPSFQLSNEELNKVVTGWGNAKANLEFPVNPKQRVNMSPERLRDAKALFTRLQCLNCHTINSNPTAAEMEGGSKGLAPDFKYANERLRKEWIVELLKDPQKMIPGTRMPGFWPDGSSPAPDIMNGDGNAQMDALADYLLSLGNSFQSPSNAAAE